MAKLGPWVAYSVPAEEKRVCKTCQQEKPLSEFYRHGASRDGHVRSCKSCYMDQRKKVKVGSVVGRLKDSLQNAKERKDKECTLSLEDLLGLWEKQNGKCFYSGVEMSFDGSDKRTVVSVDRIDSSKGYSPDNVVLCCFTVNVMKNNMTASQLLDWCRKIVVQADQPATERSFSS